MNSPYNLNVIDKTMDELDSIIKTQRQKQQQHAKLAKKLITTYKIKKIKTREDLDVDAQIINHADKSTIIATQDMLLKKQLKEKRIPTITLRQKKYLILSH